MNLIDENIREYTQGDENGIIRLHRNVFDSDLDIHRWKWQFLESHPKGKSWINLVQSGPDIVGQYCMMRHHLNFNGREITAGQSCDTMVRLDQRGKKWFTKLAAINYEIAMKNGAQAVFGFPNRNSYPGFMKHLRWIRLFNLTYYYFRIGYNNIVGSRADAILRNFIKLRVDAKKRIFILNKIKEHKISTSEKLPLDVDDFLREINIYEVLSIWKDADYLRWRYESHPHNKYLFHLLKINGKSEAMIVTKTNNENVLICEVLSRTKNVLQTLLLVYHVIIFAINTKSQKVDFYGYDNGFFNALFTRARFNNDRSDFVFCGRVFQDNTLSNVFVLPNNWSISLGDTDVV